MTVATGAELEDRGAVASNWRLVWWRFRRHHLAMASAGLLILHEIVSYVRELSERLQAWVGDAVLVWLLAKLVEDGG